MVIILASGPKVRRFDGFFQSVKILSMTSFRREANRGSRVVNLWHIKEPQAEIRASEQNLSDFSRSMMEAMMLKSVVKPNNNYFTLLNIRITVP